MTNEIQEAAKDVSIRRLLSTVAARLGPAGWTVVDHWDADLFAIGVAKVDDPRILVYVSTYQHPTGKFYVECEVPNGPEPSDYRVQQQGEVDLEALLEILRTHLSL